jgi:hypothetical protein
MSKKFPSFQFYPGDWMKDPSLRSVSLAARGLWMDMLCIMFEAQPRGYLILNGKPASVEQLARMVGSTADEVSCLVDQLLGSGVASASGQGCIYSRRLVRDEEIRGIRRLCGKQGGNPVLLKQTGVCLRSAQARGQPKVPRGVKQKSTPSSSSSTSSSEKEKPPAPPAGERPAGAGGGDFSNLIPAELDTAEFRAWWGKWAKHRREKKAPLRETMAQSQLETLATWGLARAIAVIRHTIFKGWQGLREPEEEGRSAEGGARRGGNGKKFDPNEGVMGAGVGDIEGWVPRRYVPVDEVDGVDQDAKP